MGSAIRLEVPTSARTELVDITSQVQEAVARSGVQEGMCHIYVSHTTAGLLINENADPNVREDILRSLEALVPPEARYRHREGNAPAHIKASLMGSSESLVVEGGRLVLGTWQGLFLCEFDGPRRRRVLVKVVEG